VRSERLRHVLARLSAADGDDARAARLCEVCAEVVAISGAGIMLMSDQGPVGSVCTSNAVSESIESLQFALGEGPCVDAHNLSRPVLEPDLAEPVTARWLAFTPPALQAGARAVFGFPMRIGAARMGAVNLYRDRPGALTDDQHANALVMAGVAARAILAMQAHAPPDALAHELDDGVNLHLVVHQASGMVAAQLEVTIAEALVRLRGHAFAADRALTDVASDVVARRLRFA
jgi:GAF domain